MILSSCSSTGARYRIAGNFWGWKLSQLLTFCGYSKVFSVKFVGVVSFGGTSKQSRKVFFFFFCAKFLFPPICESFLPRTFPTIRYFSVYYSQPSERYHYSHLKVCLLQLRQVGMTMKETSSSYSMYAYVCTFSDWKWCGVVSSWATQARDRYSTGEIPGTSITGVHVLRSACFSYIGCLCHCIVGVYNNVYTTVEKTSILTSQSRQNHMYLVFPRDKSTINLISLQVCILCFIFVSST